MIGLVIWVSCPSEPIAVTLMVYVPSSYTLVADCPGANVVAASLSSSPKSTSNEDAPSAVGVTVTVPVSSCAMSIFAITLEGATRSSIGLSSSSPPQLTKRPVVINKSNKCLKIFILSNFS